MTTMARSARLRVVVPALGIAQILSWGSLFYSIAVLAEPMRVSLGLSSVEVFAGFSLALGISGLLSPVAGRTIDTRGGRYVLSWGAVAAACALAILACAPNLIVLLAGWCIAGAAMSMTLYEAGFATLGAVAGTRYRQAVTGLTLIAGFASTVFWPLSHAIESRAGWRATLLVFAFLHLVIVLPLVRIALRSEAASGGHAPRQRTPPASGPAPGKIWIAACFALVAFVFSSMSAHLVGLMRLKGLTADQAVSVLSLVGPMQVSGRLLEMSVGRRYSLAAVGGLTLVLMVTALVMLIGVHGMSWLALAFVVVYGVANGVYTIVRGVLPEVLFGRERLGSLLGWLARPQWVAQAVAPAVVAFLLRVAPAEQAIALLCATDAAALGCYVWALRRARRGVQ